MIYHCKHLFCLCLLIGTLLVAQAAPAQVSNPKYRQADKFRQLEEVLPTPNLFRTGSGRPTEHLLDDNAQRVDYKISVTLNEADHTIDGHAVITYTNNSREQLDYLWMQLDSNMLRPNSDNRLTASTRAGPLSNAEISRVWDRLHFDGGYDPTVTPLQHNGRTHQIDATIVKTMLRLSLDPPLPSRGTIRFAVDWNYTVNNDAVIGERTGYELFDEPGGRTNAIYAIAQWYPRMAAFTDYTGWQHKQFLGDGEFTLEFGDFDVEIEVPADHVVAATGTLQNSSQVLAGHVLRERLENDGTTLAGLLQVAKNSDQPKYIITPDEARRNEQHDPPTERSKWKFEARNVRDFAFCSSRKFIWDAQGCVVDGRQDRVLAMSYFPNEAEGAHKFWSTYSTRAVVHALKQYSKRTFAYPYDVAISVNAPILGMEYPMLSFNGPRPDLRPANPSQPDYSVSQKAFLVGVIIHEVGHNWFPMIVNSDERQWTWMDEGLNTFLEYLAELEWDDTTFPGVQHPFRPGPQDPTGQPFPVGRGDPRDPSLHLYMSSAAQVPIMTNSESVLRLGPNAYGKPGTALTILRESIMGPTAEESRQNFDFSFQQYSRRWKFSRPNPADFLRSMEDASGIDLDWFWRGWFYTTDHVDLAITDVRTQKLPIGELMRSRLQRRERTTVPRKPEVGLDVPESESDSESAARRVTGDAIREAIAQLPAAERRALEASSYASTIEIRNVGGLVMPVLLTLYDGSPEPTELRIPAEIWRRDNQVVRKLVFTSNPLHRVELDRRRETADVDTNNNVFPRVFDPPSRLQQFRQRNRQQNSTRPLGPAKERR